MGPGLDNWTWTDGGLKFETYPVQTFALKQLWTRFHSYFLENFVHKTDYKSDRRNLRKKLWALSWWSHKFTVIFIMIFKFPFGHVGWSTALWKIFNLTFKTPFSINFNFATTELGIVNIFNIFNNSQYCLTLISKPIAIMRHRVLCSAEKW